ncbi:MAG: hypothetical protein WEC72_01130 [Chthoniobacterales bacterium]
MRSALRYLILCALVPAMWSAASANEEDPDPATMLKVPPAETRATNGETDATAAETPAPEALVEEQADAENSGESAGEDVVAAAFPLSRYEPLWERSPFQLESVAPPVESAGLAQRFALTGLAAINGEPIAFLMDRATQNRMMVKMDSTEGGVSLVQVDVQQKYTDSTATVRQGSEVGVVRFDATAAGPAMMPPPGMAQPMRAVPPGMPQPGMQSQQAAQIPGIPPRAQMPGQPAPGQQVPAVSQVPGVVPSVPGPGIPQNGQVQGDQGQMPPPRVIRRRALIPAAP